MVFVNVARFVSNMKREVGETEGLDFILSFDYKTYNIIVLAMSVTLSFFVVSKKFVTALFVGSGMFVSQVFLKDKLYSSHFLVFLAVVNVFVKIFNCNFV